MAHVDIRSFEDGFLEFKSECFTVPGICVVCERSVDFRMDHQYSSVQPDGARLLNWRERLICPHCLLNNRQRAAVGLMISMSRPDSRIYLTESVTQPARALQARRPSILGSEFLRDGTARGAVNRAGVRHEDATCLTFEDGSFDLIGTFDVLEHVPDYKEALREFYRCLAPGGSLLITAPFINESDCTIVRAVIGPSGDVDHLLPADIHGDPIDDQGALCFYHFGWDIVAELRQIGFQSAGLYFYWSSVFGHFGEDQSVIAATKRL